MLVVFGSKQKRKRANRGQKLHANQCVQNSTKSMEKYNSKTEIMKINLDLENVCGFGVRGTIKGDKQGEKLTGKLICPEFHQINGNGQVTHRDFENQLEC